uniref:Uncharacterized protein n=1 Tax=Kalanchoe fedtschenkoi TaxID=63787 RepID=A0A7N1A525_KALFE
MKSQGLRWVESIYEKFEIACEDVDSTMSQAPSKYVANPVQTVGNGVKKFCSAVMQDFFPSQVSSEKNDVPTAPHEENDYTEGYIDSSNVEGCEFYMDGEKTVKVHGAADWLHQDTVNPVQSSSSIERQRSDINETEVFCKSSDIGTDVTTMLDGPSQSELHSSSTVADVVSREVQKTHAAGPTFPDFAVPDSEYELLKTPNDDSVRSSAPEAADIGGTSYCNILENTQPTNTNSPSLTILAVPPNDIASKPVDKFVQNEFCELANSSECSIISSDSNDSFRVGESETLSCSSRSMAEQGWESSTLESSMTFSDICISDDRFTNSDPPAEAFLVDDVKFTQCDMLINGHRSTHRGQSLKSYKKLLQDAVNSRRKLVKEYKQLGLWYGDIYEEDDSTRNTHSTTVTSNSQDMTTQRQNLSDWELL